jgi:hypothetical protein
MPVTISSLSSVTLDFTNRGPGLHSGIKQAESLLDSSRVGYLLVNVNVPDGVLPVVLDRSSLYILGFKCNGGWRYFSDAEWPFSDTAESLGHKGSYGGLGGLEGNLTKTRIDEIGKLLTTAEKQQWKKALVTLVVVVSENLRLIPVRMAVLGILNEITASVPLSSLERYIKKWGQASEGLNMSVEVSENLRVGFNDPTIVKKL